MNVRKLLTLSLSLLLTACAHKPKSDNMAPGSACAGNLYLQHYGCSVGHVQNAAESGDPDAQYALGYMYFYGIGTARDPKTGTLWIERAAAQQQPLAQKALRIIEKDRALYDVPMESAIRPKPVFVQPTDKCGVPVKTNSASTSVAPSVPITNHLPMYGKSKVTSSDPRLSGAPPMTSLAAMDGSSRLNAMPEAPALKQAPNFAYSLQLMSSYKKADLDALVTRYRLQSDAQIYAVHYHGRPWYMLLYGKYSSPSRAQAAVHTLPKAVQALHPWVKSGKMLQQELKTGNV